MTIVHGGGEMGAFTPSDGSVLEATTAGSFDPAVSRCAIQVGALTSTTSFAQSSVFAQQTTFWLHWVMYCPLTGTTGSQIKLLSLYDNTGQEVFYLTAANNADQTSSTIRMFYWAGSTTFTQIGVGFSLSMGSGGSGPRTALDLNVVFGGSGSAAIYSSGTRRDSGSAAMSGANCAQYAFRTIYSVPYISQCLAASVPTIGATLSTIPITGNGLTDNWGGAYTNINEIVYNDATFITSGTANQVANYTQATTVSDPVAAVIVTARCKTTSGAPQNLQLNVNTASTDYFSSSILQTAAYSASVNVWETNPNTSAAWTAAQINAPLYYGVKSIA